MEDSKVRYNMIIEILSDLLYTEIINEDVSIEELPSYVLHEERLADAA